MVCIKGFVFISYIHLLFSCFLSKSPPVLIMGRPILMSTSLKMFRYIYVFFLHLLYDILLLCSLGSPCSHYTVYFVYLVIGMSAHSWMGEHKQLLGALSPTTWGFSISLIKDLKLDLGIEEQTSVVLWILNGIFLITSRVWDHPWTVIPSIHPSYFDINNGLDGSSDRKVIFSLICEGLLPRVTPR